MAITHTFAGSRAGRDYGYYAFIENDELVIGEDWPHEGGEVYRGTFFNAGRALRNLEKENIRLYNSICKYYKQHPEKLNVTMLMNLKPGTKFKREREDDDEKFMLIDFNVSKCFVFGEKLQGFVAALGLTDYKVFLFDKSTTVEIIE
jgi:hypothetical protein